MSCGSILRRRAAAEAVFGSVARGDSDADSDRDILIVDDDISVLRSRVLELERLKWSVAAYTFRKLRHLAERRALFIQHLKLEAKITRDQDGQLTKLLDEFEPREDYSHEVAENVNLAQLAQTVPASAMGVLLAADILYVAVRNFGVLSLANRGTYCFSYSAIISKLEEHKIIASDGIRPLLRLRTLKGQYRVGEFGEVDDVRAGVSQAMAVLPCTHFPQILCEAQPRSILELSEPDSNQSAYLHLRDLEKRFVALRSFDATALVDSRLGNLARWISAPRIYSNISKRLAPTLRKDLIEILDKSKQAIQPGRGYPPNFTLDGRHTGKFLATPATTVRQAANT